MVPANPEMKPPAAMRKNTNFRLMDSSLLNKNESGIAVNNNPCLGKL